MNKTGSSKKPMTKKKKASEDDEDAAKLLLDASDEEATDNMLGSAHLPSAEEGEGDYDYDDLDRVVGEDDDDGFLGNESDVETSEPPLNVMKNDDGEYTDEGDLISSNDGEDDESGRTKGKRKRKLEGKGRASPFASLEEYEHLMTDDKGSSGKNSNLPKGKKRKTFKL